MAADPKTALERLATGQAWREFCDELAQLSEDLERSGGPDTPLDRAEAHRYLTRLISSAFEMIVEAGDARQPAFFESLNETRKSGWDNPDNTHTNAYISGEYEYRIRGTRGDAHYMTIAVYGGSLGRDGGRRTISYVDIDDLEIDATGKFEILLGLREQPGNWVQTAADATTVMMRQTFWDKARETPSRMTIERIGREPAPPLDPDFLDKALQRAIRFMRGTNRSFFSYARKFRESSGSVYQSSPENSAQLLGIPKMRYMNSWWKLPADQAVVVEVMPPECRYWSFVLSNYWGESFDYRKFQIHTNAKRARYKTDGSLRFVISENDPEREDTNWLDPCGHTEGLWTLRWLEAQDHPTPTIAVVPADSLA